MSWPAVVLWVLILCTAFLRGPALLYLLCITQVFGTLQMLPGDGGGTNLLPQSVCAVIFVLKVFSQKGNIVRALEIATDIRRLGLLCIFLIYALFTAYVLPRLFGNQVVVVPVAGAANGTTNLLPTSGNYTQSVYMISSVATALAVSLLGSRDVWQRHILLALLASGLALIFTGVLDLVLYQAGLGSLLDPFRTASYSLLTDIEFSGSKRVVGLTPEASVFGLLCVNAAAALLFTRSLFSPLLRRSVVPATIIVLLVMVTLSTSSTGFVGLSVLVLLYALSLCIRLRSPDSLDREDLAAEIIIIVVFAFSLLTVVILLPQVLEPLISLYDAVVLQKTTSSSYIERSSWTHTALQALWDTGGIGVGLGSVRTSNWFANIASSTGLFGGALMFGFILRAVFSGTRDRTSRIAKLRQGMRFALVPLLVMYALVGTTPDFGVLAAIYMGFLTAEQPAARGARDPIFAPSRAVSISPIPKT